MKRLFILLLFIAALLSFSSAAIAQSLPPGPIPIASRSTFETWCPANMSPLGAYTNGVDNNNGLYRVNICVDTNGAFYCYALGSNTYNYCGGGAGVAAVIFVTTNPTVCTAGTIYFNTVTKLFLICSATNTITTVGPVEIVTSNPATCTVGSLIFNSVTGNFYLCNPVNTLILLNNTAAPGQCPGTGAAGYVCSAPYAIPGANSLVIQWKHCFYIAPVANPQNCTFYNPVNIGDKTGYYIEGVSTGGTLDCSGPLTAADLLGSTFPLSPATFCSATNGVWQVSSTALTANGTDTISVTETGSEVPAANRSWNLYIFEFSGNTTGLDATGGNTGVNPVTNSLTTTHANDLFLAYAENGLNCLSGCFSTISSTSTAANFQTIEPTANQGVGSTAFYLGSTSSAGTYSITSIMGSQFGNGSSLATVYASTAATSGSNSYKPLIASQLPPLLPAYTDINVPSGNISISATQIVGTSNVGGVMHVILYAYDSAAGASCIGNTTVLWTITYTDPTGTSQTQTATETITGNGGATGGDILEVDFTLDTAIGTAVTYTTTVTGGTSCSPVPSYAANLKAIQ